MTETRTEISLLIVLVDLTRFAAQSQRLEDLEIANTLDAYYEHVDTAVRAAGGTVVKLIGDAALIVFPESLVNEGVAAILTLKESVDGLMAARRWECRLVAEIHFGSVVAGNFGASHDQRFDVIGKAVNTTARLKGADVTLSAEAFQKLSPDLRNRCPEPQA